MIGFALLFGAVVLSAPYVLMYKETSQSPGALDEVFLGHSQFYRGISPITLWNEVGLASLSMAGVLSKHNAAYEQLKLLLE